MELMRVRSYRHVLSFFYSNVLAKTAKRCSVEFIGWADRGLGAYPLFCITVGDSRDAGLKDVLISAGIHGEEPAGVYALLKFLAEDISDFTDDYRFLIFPCINPFGFEHNQRLNQEGMNINREFKKDSLCREANRVMTTLGRKARKFLCTIDLHETDPNYIGESFTEADNPQEFYMWEACPDKSLRIGDEVILNVERRVPVCRWDRIYDDINNDGVIWYPEGCLNRVYAQGTTLEAFLNANYTPQAFTIETPCGWPMEQRVLAHRVALRSILELKRSV